ncbi:FecR domain-containing protein [Patescibacteria group bacterium]
MFKNMEKQEQIPKEKSDQTPKKPYLLILVVILVLIIGLAVVYFLYFNDDEETTPTVITNTREEEKLGATFIFTEGAVEYKESGGEWLRATVNTNLFEGYSIEIVGEGRAIINIDDGSAIRLGDNSGVTLISMNPNNIIVSNDEGEVYSRVAKVDRTYSVMMDDYSYEAVGTAYNTVNNETEKGVEVYESSVKVKSQIQEVATVEEDKKYYVKNTSNPDEEKQVKEMTQEEVQNKEFVMWNKEKDESENKELGFLNFENKENDDLNTEIPDDTPDTTGSITLSGTASENGVALSWTADGLDLSNGFKILRSQSDNPVYPGAYYVYLRKGEYKSYTWELKEGKTWHFRVCQYLGEECGVYSNDITVTAPLVETDDEDNDKKDPDDKTSQVDSIALSDAGDGSVSWSAEGTSVSGFKVVWSKNTKPTYPTRSGDKYSYKSEPTATSATLAAFDGTGTYYVRVCEYLGSQCGTYSNQIEVQLIK